MGQLRNKQVIYDSGISFSGGNQVISNLANGVSANDAVNLSQLQAVQSLIENFEWQESASNYITDNTVGPTGGQETLGNRLVLSHDGGTPAVGYDGASAGDIIEFDGASWVATTPTLGTFVSMDDEPSLLYYWGGSSWSTKYFEATTASTGLTKVGFDIRLDASSAGSGLGFTTGVLSIGNLDATITIGATGIQVGTITENNLSGLGTGATGQLLSSDGLGGFDWVNSVTGGDAVSIVDPNGDDVTGEVGNINKPFLTLEAARDAVSAGVIVVNEGTYNITTTDARGLSKDGVSWITNGVAILNKATTGPVWWFDETLTITPFVKGEFIINHSGASSNAIVLEGDTTNITSTIGCHFEVISVTSSTGYALKIFDLLPTSSSTYVFKGKFISSADSAVFEDDTNTNVKLLLDGVFKSTGISDGVKSNGSAVIIARGFFESVSGAGFSVLSSAQATIFGDCVGASYGVSVSNGQIILNGNTKGALGGGGTNTSLQINGICHTNELKSSSRQTHCAMVRGAGVTVVAGDTIVDVLSYYSNNKGEVVVTGSGKCTINKTIRDANWNLVTHNEVNGSTAVLYWNADMEMVNINTTDYFFDLVNGTLVLRGCHLKNKDTSKSGIDGITIVRQSGGKLIIDGPTIEFAASTNIPFRSIGGPQNIINYNVRTNIVQYADIFDPSEEKKRYTVVNVATTDCSYRGTNYEVSDLVTYDTKAKIAQQMVVLINSGPDAIIATQDTPGTDEYFYVESQDNDSILESGKTNLDRLMLTMPSHGFTDLIGGAGIQIQDADVQL